MNKREIINQFSWNSLDIFARLGINFFVYFFFLDLLGAEIYSTFVFLTLFCMFAQSLSKLGQNDFLIIADDISSKVLSSVFVINLIIGITVTLLLSIIFLLVFYFQDRDIVFLIAALIMAFSVTIAVCTHSFLSILQKKQKFKKLFFLNITSSISGLLVTYAFSGLIKIDLYPVIVVISTQIFLLISLFISSPFKFNVSLKILKSFYLESKYFIIPLTKTRPILSITKHIDSFMALLIGGDMLLLAYNTVKKLFIYPLTILYGILDRWLYPFLANTRDNKKLKKLYKRISFNIFLISIIAVVLASIIISFFGNILYEYLYGVGISNINLILLIIGFVISWPLSILPTLIYTYAKVMSLTKKLPRLSLLQLTSLTICMLSFGIFLDKDWITFGYLVAYIIMNIYIITIFKLNGSFR